MEEKINIAEILKDKPNGIRLYSPIFGECAFSSVPEETDDICVNQHNGEKAFFNSKGLYNILGEVMLFPSKEMRIWDKFAWKKGDALSCGVDNLCIFEKWANEEYTEFYAKFVTPNYSGNTFKTEKWSKETNEEVIKQYISNIEEFKGGKLNLTTLEIEKTQPEFKNGDVVFVRCKKFCYIEIFNYFKDDDLYDYASLRTTLQMIDICGKYPIFKDEIVEIRIATDSEKKQLFDALANEGKVWDSEKKQIVDLKPKWITPKPFDRVITRGDNNDIWTANIFSHMNSYGEYVAIGCVGGYHYCLPYNDETAHLVGTTDEWKGGRGMKISEFIKLLEARKKQFGNIDVVDDLGYITNDVIYNEEDNSLMIDDKKIEEAARNYCNNRYPASQDAPFIAEGFRHGAKWAFNEFLKNLWHPANEEPKKNRLVLTDTRSIMDKDHICWTTVKLTENGFIRNWSNFSKVTKITRWLYLDDLFQRKDVRNERA